MGLIPGLPWWLNGTESACSVGDTRDADSSPGPEAPLEEEMATATYSSILARIIPWTKEPGGLQYMGSTELNMTEHAHTRRFRELRSHRLLGQKKNETKDRSNIVTN